MQTHLTPEQAKKALAETVAIVKARAASALPPSEPQGRCKRSRLETCSLPVSSAERLLCRWESSAEQTRRAANDYERRGNGALALAAHDRALAFEQCARELRAEMELPKPRQPEENAER